MRHLILMTLALAVAGCASRSTPPSAAEQAYRAEVAARPVPLPATTPFEGDAQRRTVYLEWYWFGYKEALGGAGSSFCGSQHPLNDAQFKGHTDGNRDGMKEYGKAMAARSAG
jgi:hypothetical protein